MRVPRAARRRRRRRWNARHHPYPQRRMRDAEDRGLRRRRDSSCLRAEGRLLHAREPGDRAQAVCRHPDAGGERRGSDDDHDLRAVGARGHDQRRSHLSRPDWPDRPRRAAGRWPDADRGDGARGVDLQRSSGVAAPGRRVALRARPAPAGPLRHQGIRSRSSPAKHRGVHPLPRLEPRLRDPLGQHLLHALRRPEPAGADPGRLLCRQRPQQHRHGRRRRHRQLAGNGHRAHDRRLRVLHLRVGQLAARHQQPDHGQPLAARVVAQRRDLQGHPAGRSKGPPAPAVDERHRGEHPAVQLEDASDDAPDDVALVAGRRRHGLLLCLRPEHGRRDRRLSAAHWPGGDVAPLGFRVLAVSRALRFDDRHHRRAGRLPDPESAHRQHRPGLAVLGPERLGHAPVRSQPLSGSAGPAQRDP